MTFRITIKTGPQTYYMTCMVIPTSKGFERYRVWAASDPTKYIVLKSNRPLLRQMHKLKPKAISFKLIEGEMNSQHALEKIIEAIVEKVDKF